MKVGEGRDKQASCKVENKNEEQKQKYCSTMSTSGIQKYFSPPPSFIIISFNMKASIFVTGAGAREMSARFSKCFLVAITC